MAESQVRLRPITEADLPDYVRWFNDPEVTEWLRREPGLTIEQEREWFARISAPDYTGINRAIEVEGRHIGSAALHPHENGLVANFGIAIGDKAYWGRGCGTAAVREMLRIGFAERGLHRIQLEAWAENTRAIRCYEKCGFRREGLRRRGWLKGDRWHDDVLMAILREEWQSALRVPTDGICELGPERVTEVIALWAEVGLWPHATEDVGTVKSALTHNRDFACGWQVSGKLVATAVGAWDGFRGWIYRVAVLPAYRRRGIASALVREVERRLTSAGARQINTMVWRPNESARTLYAKLGYEPSEADVVRKRFVDTHGDAGEESGHEP